MSIKLKTILVEDEKTSREILKNFLIKYCPQVDIIGEAENIEEAYLLIRKHELDLVFLDVEMPFGTAFDLLDRLEDIDFETIFVTAYDQYALDALNQHAAYYLLKPLSIDELIKAVDFVTQIKEKEQQINSSSFQIKRQFNNEKIKVPIQNGFEIINTEDILYCQADDNYTQIHGGTQQRLVSKTLGFFEKELTDKGFMRIHKSYLVNMHKILSYHKGKGGYVVLENGTSLPVASSKKTNFLAYFIN